MTQLNTPGMTILPSSTPTTVDYAIWLMCQGWSAIPYGKDLHK
jgi:hypothetical protein